jgi:diguanylate cyclase (GGDEF)-like protein
MSLENDDSIFAQQLRRGFSRLEFDGPLEEDFREFYVGQNLRRTRLSGLLALLVTLAIAGLDLTLTVDAAKVDTVRLLVLSPLLAMLTIAVSIPAFERWYTSIMAIGVGLVGLTVIYIAHTAARAGASYVLADLVVVILYGCMFVGLLFHVAVRLALLMIAAHVIAGLLWGLPTLELVHTSLVLGGAAVIGGLSTYDLERSLRRNFLETGLLSELAERDGMTGLYNRRVFDGHVERLWQYSRRDGASLAIVFVDIDFFKIFNDAYGHQRGDDCLREVARFVARGAQRPLDLAARYGGEEFMLVLYDSEEDHARAVAERIRSDIELRGIPHAGSRIGQHITVSIGVAVAPPDSPRSLAGTIQLADEALYAAKHRGRNTVVVAPAVDSAETGKFRAVVSDGSR